MTIQNMIGSFKGITLTVTVVLEVSRVEFFVSFTDGYLK